MLRRRMTRLLAIAALCASLALAACGEGDGEPAGAAEEEAPAAAGSSDEGSAASEEDGSKGSEEASKDEGSGGGRPGLTIATGDSQFGQILFDGDDRAIYYFDKEKSAESECYGECAAAWPPVLTQGEPRAEGGAKGRLLATTERDDGKTQVTYDGRPLYYYVDDPAGQILCHNVDEFGGLWLVVNRRGDAVS